jgi:hypothetical protein
VEGHAGRDTRAAVGDELPFRQARQRLVPRRAHGSGDPSRDAVDRIRLAAPPLGTTRIHDDQLVQSLGELVRFDRVVAAWPCDERRPLDLLLPAPKRAVPRLEVEHGAVVMAEMAQEPPEALCAAHRPVGDDERSGPDAGG